jgi:hypothetical protein
METAQNFRQAVEMTREQFGGITLDLMARILSSVLDEAELKALIRDLEIQVEKNELSEDDAMEREHFPIESPTDDRLPSEHYL